MNKGKKVLVAMSGGVDSSVAALLLKDEGFQVAGMTMCFGIELEHAKGTKCCGVEAINDARKVCNYLEIPHYVSDYSMHLKKKVIRKFISNYLKGITPNPCIDCNRHLKFELMLNYARSLGFDFFATGHYARILEDGTGYYLARAFDRKKDQSYFLYIIKKSDLSFIKLPLGDYDKKTVRSIASRAQLPVAEKEESQDICFLDNDYRDFISALNPGCGLPGDIVNKEGKVLGRHKGIAHYTIGQRKGLGISHSEPLFVTGIDAVKNRVIIGIKEDLKSSVFTVKDVNLLVDKMPCEVKVKIRYQGAEMPCRVKQYKTRLRVLFDFPQEAVSPGQSAVFYDGDRVLGGGVILKKTSLYQA